MKAYLDIENSKTKQVTTIEVPIVSCDLEKQVVFDIDFSGFDINPCFLSVQKDKKRLAFSSYENPRAFCTYILDETDFKNSVEG